jgi:hypothetical protein
MGVTSTATGASLNTRPDVPPRGNVDNKSDRYANTSPAQPSLCESITVHLVCVGVAAGRCGRN